MNQACADEGGHLQTKYCILKKLYFHLGYISSNRSTKNSVKKD